MNVFMVIQGPRTKWFNASILGEGEATQYILRSILMKDISCPQLVKNVTSSIIEKHIGVIMNSVTP